MLEQIENRTAEEPRWNASECGARHKTRFERAREAYEQAEREGKKNE